MRKAILLTLVCAVALGAGTANADFDLGEALQGFTGKVPAEVRGLKGLNLVSPGRSPEAAGGPDSYGYIYADSAEPGGPTYSWVEINGTGTQVDLADDDSAGPLALGFSFAFYDGNFTDVHVSSNGHLTFNGGSTDFSNDCVPFPNPGVTPDWIIAPNWDDMDPADNLDPLYYQSFAAGTCPYGGYVGACFVAEFEDFSFYDSGGAVDGDAGTFEAILFDDNSIIYQYLDPGVTNGSSATIGIGNGDGSIGLVYSCDAATLAANLAVRFSISTDFPDLDLSMSASTSDMPPGGQITLTYTVQDIGTIDATGVTVTSNLPAAVSYVSDDCGGSGSAPWTWNLGNLSAGASQSCNLVVLVNDCAAFTVAGDVIGDAAEPVGNNTASMTFNLAFDSLQDGSFETGTPNAFWNEASTNFGTPLCDPGACGDGGGTAGALTGDWWAWFGGATADETAVADQDAVLTGSPSLSFWLWAPVPAEPTARGTFDVYIDATSVFQIIQGDAAYGSYTEVVLDLTPFADGGIHNIRFEGIQIGVDVVTFNLDDVTLLACPMLGTSDLNVFKTGFSDVLGIGTYTVTVNNAGPDPETAAVVTDTLPGGVTYLSDSCGGSFIDPVWTWNIGALNVGETLACIIDVSIVDYIDTLNTATVAGGNIDPVAGDNTSIAGIPEPQGPAIPTVNHWGIVLLIMIMSGASLILLRRRG